ncbi:MAG: DUF2207 domain-containing protein [Clostridiales bacterium]|nr:DUF2207 domain-containing protein [Clostridiales bacterium]
MKKLVLSLFIMISILSGSVMAAAADSNRSYYISGYKINVDIRSDGSANVEEQITYTYSGTYNGALRDVDLDRTDGIEDYSVSVVENGTPVAWSLNEGNSIDSSGEPGTYNFQIVDGLAKFKIFERSTDEDKTFIIKYKLLNVVEKYSDIAAFNRKLIDPNWEVTLDNVSIMITLPEGATKDELKVFAHGPLTGESKIVNERTLSFIVPSVSSYTMVETLAVFPTKLVPDSTNIISGEGLPSIMANEATLAEQANLQRDEAARQVEAERLQQEQYAAARARIMAVATPILLVIILGWFVLLIYLYLKYDRELKHGFEGKYYRELPGDYTPAEMSVLMSFGSVQSRDIMATLMDLVRRRHLVLNVNKHMDQGFFGNMKEDVDYVFAVANNPPNELLEKHETFLISWFIGRIGDGYSVTIDNINAYVKKRRNALQFSSDYERWCKYAKEEAAVNGFFDDTAKRGQIIGILAGILYAAIGVMITMFLLMPLAILMVIEGAIMIIFAARLKRRTAYGNEQHAMWHAFRNFLKDFSQMDKAEIPAIVMWEHYLVYAISLGVAKEVISQLPLVFNDNDLNNNNLTFMHGASYGYFAGFNTMFDNTLRTVENSITSAAAIANSARSSSSGGGGGFSGGSSGGGGGGGGGGAF